MIPENINQNFAGFIHEAMAQDMNSELLLRSVGYQLHEFNAKLRDDTLSIEEKNAMYSAVVRWKKQKS